MSEKRLIEKTEEINRKISALWNEVGALNGSVLNFYNPKSLRKAKDGILFIGTTNILKRDQTLKRFVRRGNPELDDYNKERFSKMRLLAQYAKCRIKLAYINCWLGLRTVKGRNFLSAKTVQEKLTANINFIKKIENLSLDLITTVVDELRPKCIVALNAMSYPSKKITISDSEFEKTGFHLWNDKTPFFLCSSSSELFHNGSFARLKWHVKKAVAWSSVERASHRG